MPEHVFTIVASGHAVDAQTNTLTVFSVIEELPTFPYQHPVLSVVSLWRRSPGEEGVPFRQKTRIVDPDGKIVLESEVGFRMTAQRHRTLGTVIGLALRKTGCHRVQVLVRKEDEADWSEAMGNYPLEVRAISTAADLPLLDSQRANE